MEYDMKKMAICAATVVALALSVTAIRAATTTPAPAAAAPSQTLKIGIIDMIKVIEESDAGKGLNAQLKTRQEAIQKEATEYEKKLKTEEDDILAKRKDMKPEEFETKKKGFEQEFQKSRQIIITKSAELDNARKAALSELKKDIGKAASNVADAKDLQLIIDRQAVVLAVDGMEITNDVLKDLNSSVKSIALPSGKK